MSYPWYIGGLSVREYAQRVQTGRMPLEKVPEAIRVWVIDCLSTVTVDDWVAAFLALDTVEKRRALLEVVPDRIREDVRAAVVIAFESRKRKDT